MSAALHIRRPGGPGRRRPRTALLCAVACLALVVPAVAAAAPTHPHLAAADIDGLNHACGVAVDSEGNLYVSSAGDGEIGVYDAGGDQIGTIANANEPCGLAVDSGGQLYVTERATGNVVKYVPSAFPFPGAPGYGVPVTVDASGDAAGIAVDPAADRLFVARGTGLIAYTADGTPGFNEVQRIRVRDEGGFFRLAFNGSAPSAPIPAGAASAEIQTALESLSSIDSGDVSVVKGPDTFFNEFLVTFTGALGSADQPAIEGDPSELDGSQLFLIEEQTKGFDGLIASGEFTGATGVASYTYETSDVKRHYLTVADAAEDEVTILIGGDLRQMESLRTVDGSEAPSGAMELADTGAYVAADPGYCPAAGVDPEPSQACTAGHFFVYDAGDDVVNEFEATGRYVTQIQSSPSSFSDAAPSAVAIDRSGGESDGTVHVTTGAGAGARVLAFGPLPPPSRAPLAKPSSLVLKNTCGVAIDTEGNRYVASDKTISVFPPSGETPLTTLQTEEKACELSVDSTGKVYAFESELSRVVYFTPQAFPPVAGTPYSGPTVVISQDDFPTTESPILAVAVNQANDRVYVSRQAEIIELASAAEGLAVLDDQFGKLIGGGAYRENLAVDASTGNVYVGSGSGIGNVWVIDPTGTELVARITGLGSPKGRFPSAAGSIAVEESSGHVVAFHKERGTAEEYDLSGSFVASFGKFTKVQRAEGIAIDNSGGPADGNLYVAFDDTAPATFDLTAFGPLQSAVPPLALTGRASEVGGGSATLNGSVNPLGATVLGCEFDYLTREAYEGAGESFAGAQSAPCAQSGAEIGAGSAARPVHATLGGLDPGARYVFRLRAENSFGEASGEPGVFGPPAATTLEARQVGYTEATLRASIDPTGLPTEYRFEYGVTDTSERSTAAVKVPAGEQPVEIELPVVGLAPATRYEFRAVAENEAGEGEGDVLAFTTLERNSAQSCPNGEFRTGRSAALPDCRVYELVTPADTRGVAPQATEATDVSEFTSNNWPTPPRGAAAGNRLSFFISFGPLPGFDGTGGTDGYHAKRAPGAHPAAGWRTDTFGPSMVENGVGGQQAAPHGLASGQLLSFWNLLGLNKPVEETLPKGHYLLGPTGFQLVGSGSLGTDPNAFGRYLSDEGEHVIFQSDAQLEPAAPPAGTLALYDRPALGGPTQVVSLLPGEATPSAPTTFVAATEDGASVLFRSGGTLYLRRDGAETIAVAGSPSFFAGLADDASRVFYAETAVTVGLPPPGALYAFDVAEESSTEIAAEGYFVHVSAGGERAYFTSEDDLDGGGEGTLGQPNLYLWDGSGTEFVAALDPQDLAGFELSDVDLIAWQKVVNPNGSWAHSPTRSALGGRVLVFQSHAQLTDYENAGHPEIYRFDAEAEGAERMICVSCDPGGALPAPGVGATLQFLSDLVVRRNTVIPNLTDDGAMVVFGSGDQLLPEDANDARDVYRWQQEGSGGCARPGGCLALISSGQGDSDNTLYAMTPDGRDVFFSTREMLVPQDVPGSSSIYDARAGGGIPGPSEEEECSGDACQGAGATPPRLGAPTSTGLGGGDASRTARPRPRCAKGKRRVVRSGKARCVRRKAKRQRAGRPANDKRRVGR